MGYPCQQSRHHSHHPSHTRNTFHHRNETENFSFLFFLFKDTKCFATGKEDDGQIILLLEHVTKAAY